MVPSHMGSCPTRGVVMSTLSSKRKRLLAGAMVVSVVGTVLTASAAARRNSAPPDFSSHLAGWVGLDGAGPFFEAVPGVEPGPVVSDPAHPFVPNGTDRQPTFRIADLRNPNLMPWVKEVMKKDIDEVLAGKIAFTPQSSCVAGGVPMFMGLGGPNPIVFLQTPKEVTIIFWSEHQVRHVYLNVQHSRNVKPSWYGESVGHYESDTLVVDTIGQNDKTFVDIYRTPHTDKIHVVERWRMVDDGKMLESVFTVEDPGAFYKAWTGRRRYRRVEQEPMEAPCAENNTFNLYDYHVPEADKPDF